MRTSDRDIFGFFVPTRIVHGLHSVVETGRELKNLGAKKCLLVTDKGVRDAGLLDSVMKSLEESEISYVLFDEVEENPGGDTVRRGAKLAVKERCDGIVVVGGGSPICAGRGIGVVVTNGGRIEDYLGFGKASVPSLPLIAIPTTAGSGAEVSQFIVLKDEQRQTKIVAVSPLYFPKVAILDPMLIKTLPPWQSIISGMDALSHAIEAYLTTKSTPITDSLALSAVSLIHANLRAGAVSEDLDAKEACLIGSTMANMACGNAGLGLMHAMTNPMEGMFKIPHGLAVGTLLPYVMEFNLPAAHQRFAMLAKAMGENGSQRLLTDMASKAVTAIKNLFIELGFPRKYSDSLIDPTAIPKMAKIMMGGLYGQYDPSKEYAMNAAIPSVNVRKATLKDAIELYKKAFEGWD